MTRRKPSKPIAMLIALTLVAAAASVAGDTTEENAIAGDLWTQVTELYEQAKEAGEQVPADVATWVREDIGRMGAWQYRVVEVDADPAKLETELNRLGEERWECLWIEGSGKTRRLALKRPARSYLSSVPLSTVLKLIPRVTGGGDGDGSSEP